VDESGQSLNLDFETGALDDWTAGGKAFESQPVEGDTVSMRRTSLGSTHQGNYWIGTFENFGDTPQGKLTSVPFKITHPWASFLRAGGTGCVEIALADSNEVIYRFYGSKAATMQRIHLITEPWMGERIFIRLLDEKSDGWGHISFDNFRFHATRPGRPTAPLIAPRSSKKINWEIRYFGYSDHPLANEAHWQEIIAKPPLTTQHVDSLDFQWGKASPAEGVPADKFATVATAKLQIPAGNYTITTVSDDGLRVFFDDQKVIDHWTNHPAMVDIARISASASEHTIRVEYFETGVDATLRFWMNSENQGGMPSASTPANE
jgi:hypothetical protein